MTRPQGHRQGVGYLGPREEGFEEKLPVSAPMLYRRQGGRENDGRTVHDPGVARVVEIEDVRGHTIDQRCPGGRKGRTTENSRVTDRKDPFGLISHFADRVMTRTDENDAQRVDGTSLGDMNDVGRGLLQSNPAAPLCNATSCVDGLAQGLGPLDILWNRNVRVFNHRSALKPRIRSEQHDSRSTGTSIPRRYGQHGARTPPRFVD